MKNKYLLRVLQGLLLIVLLLGLYGCGSKKADSSVRAENSTTESAKSEATMDQAAPEMEQSSDAGEVGKADTPNVSTEVGYNRKIIKTGELQLQTKDFKKCVEDIIAEVQSLKGYVQNSNIQGNNIYNQESNRRSATITVRLPQKHFDNFINKASDFGNIINATSNSEDITSAYVDTEIRLKSLKIRHERLLELLKKSGSLKDLFAIEQELGDVTYEIEKSSGQLQQYDQLVDMSTINIVIEEVYKIEEIKPVITFGDKIACTFKRSMEGLRDLAEGLFLAVVALAPFLVIVIPIVIVVIIVIRKSESRKKVKIESPDKKDKI